jgi:hypothetical protein
METSMIKLSGVLTIRNIVGRNGPSSVGRLVTEIGEFAVKDTVLDQYDEGKYDGEFGISRIYPTSYIAGGRMVIEIRATLESIALADIETLQEDSESAFTEPDPIDEEKRPLPAGKPETGVRSEEAESGRFESPEGIDGGTESDDEKLFGTLWPLGPEVKLDTTVDRMVFRKQRERLKALGYKFSAVGQVWKLPDPATAKT